MKENMKNKLFYSTILILAVLLASCAPQATPVALTSAPVANTQAPAIPNTGPSSSGSSDTVMVANNPTLGNILVDSNGMTLYLFMKDNGTTTACTGTCAQNWPALTNASPSAGSGADMSMLGTAPGTNQVTYNGHLLYTFAKDKNPGDINGEGLLGAWYAVSPAGDPVKPAAAANTPVATPTAANTTSMSSDTVMVANNPTLGNILVDSSGMTLYLFLKDNGTTTACTGVCAQNWPALTNASPTAGNGVDATLLGTVPDTNQVTYNGHLLYTFANDQNPGDVNGEGLLSAWYAVSPTGEAVKAASNAAAPTQGSNGY
jgi:predicted lipoprotein with Yx(FWY)xxD motif